MSESSKNEIIFDSERYKSALNRHVAGFDQLKAREELERRHNESRDIGTVVDGSKRITYGYENDQVPFVDNDVGPMSKAEKTECQTRFMQLVATFSDPKKMASKTLFDKHFDFRVPSMRCGHEIAPILSERFTNHPFYAGFEPIRKQFVHHDYVGDRPNVISEPEPFIRVSMNKPEKDDY